MKYKYTILILLFALTAVTTLTSCDEPNECPPKNTFFARTVIVPNPQELTAADRLYLQALRAEYDEHKNDN